MKQKKKNSLHPLGAIVKKRLIELNKTQRELATEIGTSDKYLNMIFYGRRSGNKYIGAMEKVLDINLGAYKKTA